MRTQGHVLQSQCVVVSIILLGASVATAQAPASILERHVQGLSSPDPTARLAAAQVLGELGDTAAVAPLSETARSDPRPEIRGWALRSLHQLGTSEAMIVIREVSTSDTDERVRSLGVQLVTVAGPASEATPDPFSSSAPTAPQGQPAPSTTVVVQQTTVVQQQSPSQPDIYTLRLERRARRLIVGGWVLFGLAYGPSVIAGIFAASLDGGAPAWPHFVPVVGPFIAAAFLLGDRGACDSLSDEGCNDDDGRGVAGAFSIVGGIMQLAGAVMLVPGYLRRSRLTGNGLGSQHHLSRQIAILPGGPGDGPGLSLAATF